jgi:hypothetical protein
MFLNAVRLGDHVYGTSGDMGPAFLTAIDIRTGKPAWQHRGFGMASLVHADGKAIHSTWSFSKLLALIWVSGEKRVPGASPLWYRHSPCGLAPARSRRRAGATR